MNTILRKNRAPVTWEQLLELEPRLSSAQTRREVAKLVGWSANTSNAVLKSSEAYHVAIDRLLEREDRTSSRRQSAVVTESQFGSNFAVCMEACK